MNDWIPAGFLGKALINESDVDNGTKPLPAACAVPAAFGTMANQIVQTRNRVDPMVGQTEVTTTTTYDVGNVGPVCSTVSDLLTYYYDYTGAHGSTYFVGAPVEISMLTQTLHLSTEALQSSARAGGQRFAESLAMGGRVQVALARIASQRSLQRHYILAHVATGRPIPRRNGSIY